MNTEAIINELGEKSAALHTEVPDLLTRLSPEELMEECIKRAEFKNEASRYYNGIKDQIASLEALLREIRALKSDQTTDIDKLEGRKWDLITTRKTHGA